MSLTIAYVAEHGQKHNMDDEGAITFALRKLGHKVVEYPETFSHREVNKLGAHFLLCHHLTNLHSLKAVKIPKVFWCFDLINFPGDPTLEVRCAIRMNWARSITSICDLGFMTDGDWVQQEGGKLRWLPQGFDERLLDGKAQIDPSVGSSILFTGTKNGGMKRHSFVQEMETRYGRSFRYVGGGCYREALRTMIKSHKIVVAPDGPISDSYWSNRVWNTLGLGGFLLHPYCAKLAMMYQDGHDLVFYSDRHDLHDKIARYLARPDERARIAMNGKEITRFEHLYQHRVSKLVDQVKEFLES